MSFVYLMSGKSFRIQERLKTQSGEESSLHQTAYSERIFPTSVGNFAVRNPYLIYLPVLSSVCLCGEVYMCLTCVLLFL